MRSIYDFTGMYFRSFINRKININTKIYDPFFSIKGKIDLCNRNFSSGKNFELNNTWKNYRESSRRLLSSSSPPSKYSYDPNSLTTLPRSYESHLKEDVKFRNCLGLNPLFTHYVNPVSIVKFTAKYLLSYRFFFIYMARTTFQAARPLLAFCVFGEIMKLVLANLSGGVPAYLFSFVLAFEVFYFFLQLYISYTFLMMFFTVMF